MANTLLLVFSGLVAISTVIYAVLTWLLVAETRRLREAQFEPSVIVYVQPREDSINVLDLIVENTGLGAAYDVRLGIEPDMPQVGEATVGGMGWFNKGISVLAPRHQLRQIYTLIIHDFKEKVASPRTVTLSYRNIAGKPKQASYVIDLAEMKGLRQLGTPPLDSAAKSLEKIAKAADHIESGWSKVRVITKTAVEERVDQEAMLAEMERRAPEQSDAQQPGKHEGEVGDAS